MDKKKGEGITGVWQDWGFWLNLKLVLCFQSQCLTESLGFLNPQPRQAPKRWWQHYDDSNAEKKPQKK